MLKGIIRDDGRLQDTSDALAEAASEGHVDGYPFTIMHKMLRSYHSTGPTASTIASTTWRRSVLENIVDYYARPASLWPMLRGSLVHAGLEGRFPTSERIITEKRFTAKLPDYPDVMLSGQIDVYFPQYGRLEDYKTCMTIPAYIKDEHAFQLATYYWLLRWAGYEVREAVINYISWSDMKQVAVAEVSPRVYSTAVNHPYFKEEHNFQSKVSYGFHVLSDGYMNNEVPSMELCNHNYCRNCPMKWACDQVAVEGEVIVPESYVQKGA